MLTPEQIAAFRDAAGQIADPINNFLLEDIARRVAGAGQLTSTAAYQIYRVQQLGLSRRVIKKRLRELLGVNRRTLKELLTQAAEVGYNFDIKNFPGRAVPFRKNEGLQQTVAAAVKLAQDDFTNLTQTLGMVGPDGVVLPLQNAYRASMDYVFEQVFTGAADYNTAIRRATKNLADQGVRVIDYESEVHTGLEAAARRTIMGGLGLMQEQITQQNHDNMGCDGWEISAHAASAPDHEPIQGKQYTDEAYERLNHSLVRRIGTLNCGHAAFPILFGLNAPQYTAQELRKFREDNKKGISYEGRHYTLYEATQMQRKVERAIRRQKNRILVDEATGDKEKLLTDQIKIRRLNEEYKRFSTAAGLRTEPERAQVAGFGRSQAAKAERAVAKSDIFGIIKAGSGGVTISGIESPIEQRHTGKGNPNAILHFGAPLNNQQARLLELLPNFESRATVSKFSVSMADLSALTAATGDEFAMFTRKKERIIIRGNSRMVNIGGAEARELGKQGYRWSGHTHPGTDKFCLAPSDGDKEILDCFGQKQSSIYNSKGQRILFNKEGIV